MGATKNNTGGHLKIRGTRTNSNMRGHTKFLRGLKNRGGKAFRGPVTEGCNKEQQSKQFAEQEQECNLWLSHNLDP